MNCAAKLLLLLTVACLSKPVAGIPRSLLLERLNHFSRSNIVAFLQLFRSPTPECQICFNEIPHDEPSRELFFNCRRKNHGNQFCSGCVRQHIRTRLSQYGEIACPICREPMSIFGESEYLDEFFPPSLVRLIRQPREGKSYMEVETRIWPIYRRIRLIWHVHRWGSRKWLILHHYDRSRALFIAIHPEERKYVVVDKRRRPRGLHFNIDAYPWPYRERINPHFSPLDALSAMLLKVLESYQAQSRYIREPGVVSLKRNLLTFFQSLPSSRYDRWLEERQMIFEFIDRNPHLVYAPRIHSRRQIVATWIASTVRAYNSVDVFIDSINPQTGVMTRVESFLAREEPRSIRDFRISQWRYIS